MGVFLLAALPPDARRMIAKSMVSQQDALPVPSRSDSWMYFIAPVDAVFAIIMTSRKCEVAMLCNLGSPYTCAVHVGLMSALLAAVEGKMQPHQPGNRVVRLGCPAFLPLPPQPHRSHSTKFQHLQQAAEGQRPRWWDRVTCQYCAISILRCTRLRSRQRGSPARRDEHREATSPRRRFSGSASIWRAIAIASRMQVGQTSFHFISPADRGNYRVGRSLRSEFSQLYKYLIRRSSFLVGYSRKLPQPQFLGINM